MSDGPVPMRFRTDSISAAENHAKEKRGEKVPPCDCGEKSCTYHPVTYRKVQPAAPADTWPLTHYRKKGEGPNAGYAICCPRCLKVHYWSSANNCSSKRKLENGGVVCDHTGTSSCWNWFGSPEKHTLHCEPSLFANGEGSCQWHGFLTHGVLGPNR